LVTVKIGILHEEALSLSGDEIGIFIRTKNFCIETKERPHLGRRFEWPNLKIRGHYLSIFHAYLSFFAIK
jgi:hypothetical protein